MSKYASINNGKYEKWSARADYNCTYSDKLFIIVFHSLTFIYKKIEISDLQLKIVVVSAYFCQTL